MDFKNCLNFGDSWRSDLGISRKIPSLDLLSRSWSASYYNLFCIGKIAIHSNKHKNCYMRTNFHPKYQLVSSKERTYRKFSNTVRNSILKEFNILGETLIK